MNTQHISYTLHYDGSQGSVSYPAHVTTEQVIARMQRSLKRLNRPTGITWQKCETQLGALFGGK